ncbi:MAG: ParB/RepB/Spo0J family partition protein [Chloroflexota bacterium]
MSRKSFKEGLTRLQATKTSTEDLARVVQLQEDGVVPLAGAKLISIDLIRPNPRQARRDFPQESLDSLATSIRERGLLQPVRVRADGSGFQLVAGERRWRAARMAGLTEIPAIVSEGDDSQAMLDSLIENLQREDLNPVDRAEGLRQLKLALGNIAWSEVGARIGVTERRIFQLLDVARLHESVKADLRAGRLTEKHTRAMSRLPQEAQRELREVIKQESLSASRVSEVVKAMKRNPGLGAADAVQLVRRSPDVPVLAAQCTVLATKIDATMGILGNTDSTELADLEKALRSLLERVSAALARMSS